MSDRRVDRRLLPRTFGPWFARFSALTEIQRRAIPVLMEGRDALLSSATASGKTEAFAAPAAEIAAAHGSESAAVLVVSPTRALANDLKRRLEGPMSLVEVSFGRYTGEHKELVGGELPSVVVATPEALDSLLARRPAVFARTRMVVVDEVHVLDNTPRGDQLRVLLERLERACTSRPQRVAVSATIERPEELGARYLRDPALVVVPDVRPVRARVFDGTSVASVAQHLDELARSGFRKVLVFCRTRNQVERYAAKLGRRTRFGDAVFAHHGSLAKAVRERTERLFQESAGAVCFATLTLEMGIDIGTVDYVLLVGLPADVASLMQRIGRGSRRGETTRAGFVAEDEAERHVFTSMLRLGTQGRLCAAPYGFRPSVIAQQALVLACSRSWLELVELELALPQAVQTELGSGAAQAIAAELVEGELLEPAGLGRFVASEAIERRYEQGTLHSNIDDAAGIDVVDRLTGDVIGRIDRADSRRIELGGGEREVVQASHGRLLTDRGRGARAAFFRPRGSPSVSLELGRAVVEGLEPVEPGALVLVPVEGGAILVHGLGSVGALFLAQLLARSIGRRAIDRSSPYTIWLAKPLEELPPAEEEDLTRFLDEHLEKLVQLTSPGPWDASVPRELRLAATRRILGLDELLAFLGRARLAILAEPVPGLGRLLAEL